MSKIIDMQKKKTGKLFKFCFLAPAIISGASKQRIREMGSMGEELGLIFQIADDLLDQKGIKKNVGKPVKKDQKKEIETAHHRLCSSYFFFFVSLLKENL